MIFQQSLTFTDNTAQLLIDEPFTLAVIQIECQHNHQAFTTIRLAVHTPFPSNTREAYHFVPNIEMHLDVLNNDLGNALLTIKGNSTLGTCINDTLENLHYNQRLYLWLFNSTDRDCNLRQDLTAHFY